MRALDIESAAREVKAAQDSQSALTLFTTRYPGFDLAVAYDVAQCVHDLRVGEGSITVGRKIGFTNPEMWQIFGVQQPVWAYVYDRTVIAAPQGHVELDIGKYHAPRIEPEIVVHFRSAPPTGGSPGDILACIDWIAHGIEIVQCHYPDWKFQAADTVADWGLHGALIVGRQVPVVQFKGDLSAMLERFSVDLSCDGVLKETGYGRNVLGSPLAAVSHLLGVLSGQPGAAPIQAGEIITTGTLTKAYPVQAGETWRTQISGLELPGIDVSFFRGS
ncbi:decarboxylase [Achromobacter xylosoxidans]|uniref:Decarboxylase n=1 Tax=Alcaligenes xylosoxydans xylosoxydans TaxID=85698 RepID=A0A9X3L6Q9_ALCXX|nr:fumarylacetoacetate hydrolase family protein [Achromobacter xylosoxidans]MCZ8405368.1 decarboxylase [Achromobacter xylosoxidans]